MEGELLVYLIMVPIYLSGFVVIGCMGHRKNCEKRVKPTLDKSLVSEIIFPGSRVSLETEDYELEAVPTDRANTTIAYFHTDTLSLYSDESCCSPWVWENLKYFYDIMVIYSIPLLNVLDYISDISMVVFFLSQNNTRDLGIYSMLVIILHRVVSAIILGDWYGWETGVRQLLDLEVFPAVYISTQRERVVLQIIQMKILEGFLESFPQLLFQSYYLIKPSKHADETALVHISMILSLLSLSKSWMFSDEVAIPEEGFFCCRRSSEGNLVSDTVIWDHFLWYSRVIVIWAWRFGEVAVSICIIVGFANVVSARGAAIGSIFMLLLAFFIQSLEPKTKKIVMVSLRNSEESLPIICLLEIRMLGESGVRLLCENRSGDSQL